MSNFFKKLWSRLGAIDDEGDENALEAESSELTPEERKLLEDAQADAKKIEEEMKNFSSIEKPTKKIQNEYHNTNSNFKGNININNFNREKQGNNIKEKE